MKKLKNKRNNRTKNKFTLVDLDLRDVIGRRSLPNAPTRSIGEHTTQMLNIAAAQAVLPVKKRSNEQRPGTPIPDQALVPAVLSNPSYNLNHNYNRSTLQPRHKTRGRAR